MKEETDVNISETVWERFRGFYIFHSSFVKKYFGILLFAITLGAICGIVMVLFNYLLIFFELAFQNSLFPYFISPIIAGVLTGFLVKFCKCERILGTGAAEFIEDVNLFEMGEINERDKSERGVRRVKNLIAKTTATSWTFGSGMVCGLEGPGLLIGGNLGYLFFKSEKFGLKKGDALFIGASACTSAILKAPISGALFCAELPYYNHIRYSSLIPSLIASCVAYIIYCLFFDFEPLIQTDITITPESTNYLTLLPLLIFFGIISGLFVLIFMSLLRTFRAYLNTTFFNMNALWILPLLGAIGYSVFLFFIIPILSQDFQNMFLSPDTDFLDFFTFMVKNHQIEWTVLLILLLLFGVAIFFSIGTSNSAGIILPMMLIGAILGGFFGVLFYPEHPELFVLIGIAAVLGASLNNPITAIFLLIEMTWEPFLFIPASIVTIISYIFSGPSAIIPGQKRV
ncbi:MAG: hypothetical protein GF383_05390 [Candidatus Lokiarchaeota archaeon]|nr:hypothetical protein [Candidatus Lokiarchaeota archaeon]MBD3339330.1 hypothetical protein [Candidatus Lokiarchaeota archaeon]